MNKTSTFLVLAAFAVLSACASDDAVMDDNQADEDMATQQPAAVAPAPASSEAMAQDEEDSTGESAAEPMKAAATSETSASDASDNLVSTCMNGGEKRVITVVYDNEATGNVCEVTYEKSSGVQTLWSAENERDYCLDKAKAFVEKQEGWGWTCSNLE